MTVTTSAEFIVKYRRLSDGEVVGKRVGAVSIDHAIRKTADLAGYTRRGETLDVAEVWGRDRNGFWGRIR